MTPLNVMTGIPPLCLCGGVLVHLCSKKGGCSLRLIIKKDRATGSVFSLQLYLASTFSADAYDV